jgi:hypothetical protein
MIITIFFVNTEYISPQNVLGSSSSSNSNSDSYEDVALELDNNQSEQDSPNAFEPIPSNISVHVEPKDVGILYLSAIIADGNVEFTRDLDDELFPFQTTNWYQLVTLTPNYTGTLETLGLKFDNLIIGQLQDFDNFDELLEQARVYSDVPINETFILDLPNNDVSFMQLQIPYSDGTTGIYYGLFDGNQQGDKSEINLRLNPESTLKILESDSAIDIKTNEQLFNVTNTLVCNDIYKLGYEKCH